MDFHVRYHTSVLENKGYEDYTEPNRSFVHYSWRWWTIRNKTGLDRILEYWDTHDQSDYIYDHTCWNFLIFCQFLCIFCITCFSCIFQFLHLLHILHFCFERTLRKTLKELKNKFIRILRKSLREIRNYIEKTLKKLGNKLWRKFDKTLSFEEALKYLWKKLWKNFERALKESVKNLEFALN